MKIKILICISIILFPNIVGACKYSGKISQCDSAIKKFIGGERGYITPGASIKSIEDFPCLQDSPEKRVYQIALDENFSEIDTQMEENLAKIYEAKDFFFGKDAHYTYYDGINYIAQQKKYYKDKYDEACRKSLVEVTECLKNTAYEPEQESISISGASQFLKNGDGRCYDFARLKVEIFSNIAYNGLLLNREKVSKDQKKLYQQGEREQYNTVLDGIMFNLSYIERIWKGWPSKTKNPL